jgi:hypothetical protein
MTPQIAIDQEKIEEFCRRYHVRKLSLFGSVLRPDFRPDSDVDVLVRFVTSAEITLSDLADMEAELSGLLNRKADLIEEASLKNPYRRHAILHSEKTIYAA